MNLKEQIQSFFKGEVYDDARILKQYSRDASLFEIRPEIVCAPKDVLDIQQIVSFAQKNKGVSITCRAGGSDMTGGPLSESIVLDITKHLNDIKEIKKGYAVVEPGVLYKDFEKRDAQARPSFTDVSGLS